MYKLYEQYVHVSWLHIFIYLFYLFIVHIKQTILTVIYCKSVSQAQQLIFPWSDFNHFLNLVLKMQYVVYMLC